MSQKELQSEAYTNHSKVIFTFNLEIINLVISLVITHQPSNIINIGNKTYKIFLNYTQLLRFQLRI